MAWASDKPADSEKIRDLGTVIRPNWVSIEQGEDANAMVNSNAGAWLQQYSVALIERDGRANNQDPVVEAETFFVYCREGETVGVAEGHMKDPAGNVIQITSVGRLGGETQNLVLQNFQFNDNTTSYNAGNIVKARGTVSSTGVLTGAKNIGSAPGGAGVYTVKISADVLDPGTLYQVICNANVTSVVVSTITRPAPVAATTTDIVINTFDSSSKAAVASGFDIMVIGGI